jgi:hypothetical protein
MREDARNEGQREESEKWRKVVEIKDAALANKDAEIERLRALLGGNTERTEIKGLTSE